MGINEKAIEYTKRILVVIKDAKSKMKSKTKLNYSNQDYFLNKTENIKLKKMKARTS